MRVIAIVNQKGGCGKTTTTVNLAGALAAEGHRVLIVDMDPQAHATLAMGLEPDDLESNLYEVLVEPAGAGRLDSIIIDVSESIDIAPSSIVLSALEQKLASERHDARIIRAGDEQPVFLLRRQAVVLGHGREVQLHIARIGGEPVLQAGDGHQAAFSVSPPTSRLHGQSSSVCSASRTRSVSFGLRPTLRLVP